jgi:hypothetical protein
MIACESYDTFQGEFHDIFRPLSIFDPTAAFHATVVLGLFPPGEAEFFRG